MSRTTKQWVDCLVQPIFIMLLFVKAEREGDWSLHLYLLRRWRHVQLPSSHYIAQAVYGRRTRHAPHRWALERHLVGSLHRINLHASRARSFRDNRYNSERDNPRSMESVAQYKGTHVEWCRRIGQSKTMLWCAIRKNGQFAFTTIHRTGRASAKQLRHVLTCLMWTNIPRTLSLVLSPGDPSTILHSTCSML